MLVEIYVVINEKEKERTDEWIGENWTRRLVRIACGESKKKTRMEKRKDNPVRTRWNENAVTRNKRGDPKLLVEVQSEGWE